MLPEWQANLGLRDAFPTLRFEKDRKTSMPKDFELKRLFFAIFFRVTNDEGANPTLFVRGSYGDRWHCSQTEDIEDHGLRI